jgi:hypothetical protein
MISRPSSTSMIRLSVMTFHQSCRCRYERNSPILQAARRTLVLAGLCLAAFIISLDTTIVNLALPALMRQPGATITELQWVVDAYNLVATFQQRRRLIDLRYCSGHASCARGVEASAERSLPITSSSRPASICAGAVSRESVGPAAGRR